MCVHVRYEEVRECFYVTKRQRDGMKQLGYVIVFTYSMYIYMCVSVCVSRVAM